ncbi:MAG: serine protease [Saprospiraceae bacterium]|nr:serine protease [Saprospiraceae bacterium]
MKPFSNAQLNELTEILKTEFNRQLLRVMLASRLGKQFDDYTTDAAFNYQVFEIARIANMEGWHYELANALLIERRAKDRVIDFAASIELTTQVDSGLQALINDSPSPDIMLLRMKLLEWEQQVCRIETTTGAGTVYGTGFLVGPDLVLTNYHVVEKLITGDMQAAQVRARFDYKALPGVNGTVIYKGTPVNLLGNGPVVAYSSYAPLDVSGAPLTSTWPKDQLDFALLRLAERVGEQPAGPMTNPGASEAGPRGWISFPSVGFTLSARQDLYMVQHPQGNPIKVAFATQAIIGSDRDNQRVRYRVNSEKGSSGSPCFNAEWKLVALHHSGDPNFWHPDYNQGIPINNIAQYLKQENKQDLLTYA